MTCFTYAGNITLEHEGSVAFVISDLVIQWGRVINRDWQIPILIKKFLLNVIPPNENSNCIVC